MKSLTHTSQHLLNEFSDEIYYAIVYKSEEAFYNGLFNFKKRIHTYSAYEEGYSLSLNVHNRTS